MKILRDCLLGLDPESQSGTAAPVWIQLAAASSTQLVSDGARRAAPLTGRRRAGQEPQSRKDVDRAAAIVQACTRPLPPALDGGNGGGEGRAEAAAGAGVGMLS